MFSSCLPRQAGALMVEVDWEARSKQKALLNELLTRHLLTLDSIQAAGGETPPEVRLSITLALTVTPVQALTLNVTLPLPALGSKAQPVLLSSRSSLIIPCLDPCASTFMRHVATHGACKW